MTQVSQQTLIENYEVVRVMGKGSFGKVFLVRDIINNQEFAMKKYSKYHLSTNGRQQMLKRSINILNALNHSNIIKFLQYTITSQDSIFLMFEPCKKGSLEDIKTTVLKAKDQQITSYILFQLVEGLLYLKNMCVAHRDIKPSNITFNSEGKLKIIDFDEAVVFKEIGSFKDFGFDITESSHGIKLISRRSMADSFVGTELYMSPQMKLQAKTDERGDIWALGCIIFEMTVNETLQPSFQQEEDLIQGIHIKLQSMRKNLPSPNTDCMNLLQRILIIDPSKRITIEDIYNHQFFKKLREQPSYLQKCTQKFKKMLRGNHNIDDPYAVYDALQIDLIGMKEGQQRFQLLKTVIYFKRNFSYDLFFLYGGGIYFKLANVQNESDKIYIYYDSVDKLYIKDDQLIIGVKPESWSKQNNTFEVTLKHLYPDMLGRLYDLITYILND